MITREELTALTQLLQRTLMSAAEAQWTQAFLARLQASLIQQARAANEERKDEQRVPGSRRMGDDAAGTAATRKPDTVET